MNLSSWFDALPAAGKIGAALLITLAALGAAIGFVASIVRLAGLSARLTGRRRGHDVHDRHGRP